MNMTQEKGLLARFRDGEDGAATIEAVLWLPAFLFMMVLIADASFLFFGQNKAYRIIQDANRQLSVGRLRSSDQVSDFVAASLEGIAPSAEVASSISDGAVTSVVSIPASDLVAVGAFSAVMNPTITVTARHLVEY